MHGRLKVKSTAEQLEAKRKEREKKLQLYNKATSKIFEKKQNDELDEEMLMLTGEVLAANTDFYTLWNYRKETFLKLSETKEKDEMKKLFSSELFFLESCLKMNPKSYGTWHHRYFVMDAMPEPDWDTELELCNQFLKYDERNFHCWDYRRFVVKRSQVSPQEEFEFSLSKISNNFSNYSSWHYRSKLLPILYPDPSQPMGVLEEALLKEYELVQNGFFTDPEDQSNWFYHRWLMGRGEQKQKMNCFHVSRSRKRILLSFTQHIQVGKEVSVAVECNGSMLDNLSWQNHLGNNMFSNTWVCNNVDLPKKESCELQAQLFHGSDLVCSASLQLGEDDEFQSFSGFTHSRGSRFSQELSAVKAETLQQELEAVMQLIDIETDNKWAILTVVLLMKSLDPVKYKDEIMNNLDKLEALDLTRINYYKDLRSKFMVEGLIEAMDSSSLIPETNVSLPAHKLTKFYHPELLPLLTHLDLTGNQLTEVKHFNHMQNLQELMLDDNQVSSCEGLQCLQHLEKLSLRNNLMCPENLQALTVSCQRLKSLDITGNPVCDSPLHLDSIREMLPNVELIPQHS